MGSPGSSLSTMALLYLLAVLCVASSSALLVLPQPHPQAQQDALVLSNLGVDYPPPSSLLGLPAPMLVPGSVTDTRISGFPGVGGLAMASAFTRRPGHRRPGHRHRRPGYGHKRPGYGHNRPGYGHNRPVYGHNRPGYGHNRPGYGHNRPSSRFQGLHG